ncbi:hypothetical protein [Oceanobacillus sp. CAU 1775]
MEKKTKTDELIHRYPGTDMEMIPGDILYSHKYALSSLFVGHIAIVGENYRIYHINRWKPFGHADSMPVYLSRHKKGEKLTVMRYKNQEAAKQAAIWAMLHYDESKRYVFERDLLDVENNYCSKFIWQAFYFGNDKQVDLLKESKRRNLKQLIMPGLLYKKFNKILTFRNT